MTAARRIVPLMGSVVFIFGLSLAIVWGAETNFDFFVKLSRAAKTDKARRNQSMKWFGGVTKDEEKEFVDYFDTVNREFVLFSLSQILKDDLDGDGRAEYVVNLLVEEPQPFYYGEVLAVAARERDAFRVIVVSGPNHTIKRHRRMQLLDVTGDGLKEIIEQDSWGAHDEAPERSGVIYKNDDMRFRVVYKRNNYDFLQFEDLDGKGTLEVLEKRRETPFGFYAGIDGWWVNIYNWDGTGFEKTNSKYLSFYLEKAKYYQGVLDRSIKRNEKYKRKAGKDNLLEKNRIRAMREYLRRIAVMGIGKQ